jgi:periplasmic protein TonB
LPSAALLTLTLFLGFLHLLADEHDHRAPLSPPLDVGLLEIPAPASGAAPALEPFRSAATDASPPSPAPEPTPTPAVTPPPPPSPESKIVSKPSPQPTKSRRIAPPAAERTAPAAPPSAPAPPAPEAPPAANNNALGLGKMGPRALYKPLPEIPAALRRRTLELIAVARFRVATDGSAEVELIEPTSDPDLNRALLDKLRTWRFFPAMEQGRPVASSLDIRIPISVQ